MTAPELSEELRQMYSRLHFVCPDEVEPLAPPAAFRSWLDGSAVPVSLEPEAAGQDLRAVAAMLGTARCIGLGEATHGTHEFFTFKHRLIRHLVEHGHLTAVTIEAFPADCLVVDAYLRGAEIDPRAAVSTMYGGGYPWDTEEVLDLVCWLRTHNDANPERPVGLYGFDVGGWACAAPLAKRLTELDSELAARYAGPLREIATQPRLSAWMSAGSTGSRPLGTALEDLAVELDDRRADLEAVGKNPWSWAHARRLVVGLSTAFEAAAGDGPPPSRDEQMARHALRLLRLEGPDGRIVVWAHNGHVFRSEFFVGVPAQGMRLASELGADYTVLGFGFDHGSYRGHDIHNGFARAVLTVPPAIAGTADEAFRASASPAYAIDLRSAPEPVRAFLGQRLSMRQSGAGWGIGAPEYAVGPLLPAYDVLVYVAESTPTRPLSLPDQLPASTSDVPLLHTPQNLDFGESDGVGRPRGWSVTMSSSPKDYRVEVEQGGVHIYRDSPWYDGSAGLQQAIPAQQLEVATAVTGSWSDIGAAVLLTIDAYADAVGQPVATASTEADGPGSMSVRLDPPPEATSIRFGVRVYGNADVHVQPLVLDVGRDR